MSVSKNKVLELFLMEAGSHVQCYMVQDVYNFRLTQAARATKKIACDKKVPSKSVFTILNVDFKIASKVIVTRIEKILP